MGFAQTIGLLILTTSPSALLASPQMAGKAVAVSEPTDLMLFSMGVMGLIIGRRTARGKSGKPDNSDLSDKS